ncbi:hypothetical protein CCAND93_1090007 [Capnocytophaga canis]|uniref:Uncharacterized protein n=1 Tax=Capnocytophaga canis TaxID=1848903 RepID=A0A0B7IER3_9FLAO|nr:hypothetical protein CCAND93_1090007 [Capnocytophaga canis]
MKYTLYTQSNSPQFIIFFFDCQTKIKPLSPLQDPLFPFPNWF